MKIYFLITLSRIFSYTGVPPDSTVYTAYFVANMKPDWTVPSAHLAGTDGGVALLSEVLRQRGEVARVAEILLR